MKKILMFTGGKESVYAAILEWPIEYLLILIYDFPRPSPHILNLEAVIRLGYSMNIPIIIKRLPKGKEYEYTVKLLKSLNIDAIVAGDQGVEENLKYMEKIANDTSALLIEPLWSIDPEELFLREAKEISSIIIGVKKDLTNIICNKITEENASKLIDLFKKNKFNPIGELGEYHTFAYNIKRFKINFNTKCLKKLLFKDYLIAKISIEEYF